MADTVTRSERSAIMAAVRSDGNASTELRLIAVLRSIGARGWRRHYPLAGRPDFVFRAQRIVVFVDGCFWHGCPEHLRLPAANGAYWRAKIACNRARDRKTRRQLVLKGWRVVQIWEHELKARALARLRRRLRACLTCAPRRVRPSRSSARPPS